MLILAGVVLVKLQREAPEAVAGAPHVVPKRSRPVSRRRTADAPETSRRVS
ncbi:hypothetical protein [Amnibacterium sp.]|uniref:hypothetical protein n=1 Tax=Amnibacterium sp. TaxID=1872496 RepID=UPI003F7C2F85